ncbi:MAG: ribbon-helix-helix protein, CopG family [Acidimicrobiales bacterium]|nr:ribbon-helix-helix protein, CopG family [Acidimicrobiales bacterium]
MTKRIYGHTKSGKAVTDEMIERLADEAERGYNVDEILGRRGRPRLGRDKSVVESVRMDPELKQLLVERAAKDGLPVSEVIRTAIRRHLEAS